MKQHRKSEKGFTLVELSIVIVIIGLIVAGVVGGQALVSQAQLRAVITESNDVKTAINAFKGQYDALPGDYRDAEATWTTGACAALAAGACNGNGNRFIEGADAIADDESLKVWVHLNEAGIFPGDYTGNLATIPKAGNTLPESSFTNTVMSVFFDDPLAASGGRFGNVSVPAGTIANTVTTDADHTGHIILFGGAAGVAAAVDNAPVFTTTEARSIDTKLDDGVPTDGIVVAVGGVADAVTDCLDATVYNLDTDQQACALAFGF